MPGPPTSYSHSGPVGGPPVQDGASLRIGLCIELDLPPVTSFSCFPDYFFKKESAQPYILGNPPPIAHCPNKVWPCYC